MDKICNKCKLPKSLDELTKCKTSKDGYRNICKNCTNLAKNNGKYKPYQKEYRIINRKTKLNYMFNYNAKTEVKKRVKEWGVKNRVRIRLTQKKYKRTIPHIVAWRNTLTHSLERLGKKKEGHTIDLLGYSALDLKQHMLSLFTECMSWNNYGEWHVDHIKKISEFTNDTHPSIVNALSNLRPLWATTREINGVVYEGNLNRPKVS